MPAPGSLLFVQQAGARERRRQTIESSLILYGQARRKEGLHGLNSKLAQLRKKLKEEQAARYPDAALIARTEAIIARLEETLCKNNALVAPTTQNHR